MQSYYTQYYLKQSGRGLSDIGGIYKTPSFYQAGRGGIGSFFAGLYKYLKPLVSSGISALADQSIKTGTNILSEIGQKPFKQILKEQGKNAASELKQRGINKLKRMQGGSGKRKKKSNIKRLKRGKKQHSHPKRRQQRRRKTQAGKGRKRRRKTKSKIPTKKSRFVDIFDNNNG